MSMQQHIIPFLRREDVCEGTYKYVFQKPEEFTFIAGQYVVLEVLNPQHTDDRPTFRSLSIASAPCEDELFFIMRHSDSGFKQSMHALTEGDQVSIKGPLGDFVLPEDPTQAVVFLVAGVGITPVRSMLVQSVQDASVRSLTLLCSNRAAQAAPCLDELMEMQLTNYRAVHTMTDASDGWRGPTGRLDVTIIADSTHDLDEPLFYIVGTKGFIEGMKANLAELNIDKDRIIIDNFG